jgi:hypothetical protein
MSSRNEDLDAFSEEEEQEMESFDFEDIERSSASRLLEALQALSLENGGNSVAETGETRTETNAMPRTLRGKRKNV